MIDKVPERRLLPVSVKFGYMLGQYTASLSYNLFYFFFLIFLTDIAKIPATSAGILILVAILWDAITDPIVGTISDNLKLKEGRRRPLMLRALIPLSLIIFLLYANFEGIDPAYKTYYFGVITLVFWLCYKIFVIPFISLGAEMTADFNERTSLRVWASLGIYGSILLVSVVTPLMVSFSIVSLGTTDSVGWMTVGAIFGLLTFVTGLVCWYMTRGREIIITSAEATKKQRSIIRDIFTTYKSLFKLSAVRYLAFSSLVWSGASAMLSGSLIYLMQRNLGLSAGMVSFGFLMLSCIAIVWVLSINWITQRYDKQKAYYIGLAFGAISMILFSQIGFPHIAFLFLYFICCEVGNTFFWTISFSMMYDLSELDELVSGKRREGAIASMILCMQKAGAAMALGLTGIILGLSGYDGSLLVQPESAQSAIHSLATWIPGIIGIIAALFGFAYPLTGIRFNRLMEALSAKRAGQPYHVGEELEKLL